MACKVDSLIERHDLTVPDADYDSLDAYLVARWTGADGRSALGYKALTTWFNKRVLKRLYEEHDRETTSIQLDGEYDVITGEATIQREELAADLATDGLDIERVETELVSWSTMRHHLKDCLDAEKEPQSASTDWEANTVQMAKEKTAEKAQSVLSSLTSKGQLPNADQSEVDVQVKLSCPDCSVRVPFEDAVERGYVCETHLLEDDETETRSAERVRNHLIGLAIPYGIIEAVHSTVLGEPLLLDAIVSF